MIASGTSAATAKAKTGKTSKATMHKGNRTRFAPEANKKGTVSSVYEADTNNDQDGIEGLIANSRHHNDGQSAIRGSEYGSSRGGTPRYAVPQTGGVSKRYYMSKDREDSIVLPKRKLYRFAIPRASRYTVPVLDNKNENQ